MIDAILHVLDQVGPASISLWTWTVAEYEVQVLTRLMRDNRLTGVHNGATEHFRWGESMGEVADIRAALATANPHAKEQDVQIYADAFADYLAAVENIRRNGQICAHPRNGQPMENPYTKVKIAAIAIMTKVKTVKETDSIWKQFTQTA